MSSKMISFLFSLLMIVVISPAYAQSGGIDACGDIYIEADAGCEVIPPGASCKTLCTPLRVEASCAADLQVGCKGMCQFQAEASCEADCNGQCETTCVANPAVFNCQGECELSCSAGCSTLCQTNNNASQCEASCRAECGASCSAECDIVAPNAECSGLCEASCRGGCTADANLDCQISCQSSGYLECTTEITGGCETQCEAEEGALFCDGQFIDHGGNLDQCIRALRNLLDIEVAGYADASCSGSSCQAEAGASVSCSHLGSPRSSGLLAILLILSVFRRRIDPT